MSKRLRDKGDGWKDVVGMPDDWDKQNVQTCIDNFSRRRFRECEVYSIDHKTECDHLPTITGKKWIELSVKASRKDAQLGLNPFNEYGMKNKESEGRLVSSMPVTLYNELSDTMPTVFRDKEHFSWFIKNFKRYFMVPDKY